jgi:hypothetical protein
MYDFLNNHWRFRPVRSVSSKRSWNPVRQRLLTCQFLVHNHFMTIEPKSQSFLWYYKKWTSSFVCHACNCKKKVIPTVIMMLKHKWSKKKVNWWWYWNGHYPFLVIKLQAISICLAVEMHGYFILGFMTSCHFQNPRSIYA